jgi:hypothetical protein
MAQKNLTEPQIRVLKYIHESEMGKLCTYSWYVRAVSTNLSIPESTAKWCLNNLRDMCLIEAGTSSKKGIPLRLTYPGLVVAEGLARSRAEAKEGGGGAV